MTIPSIISELNGKNVEYMKVARLRLEVYYTPQ